ncbi:CBL-interacting serine/threonine-protein kinase 5 [Glycine soja]|nr:CBL-interacting serine/threonine-protein kinase 5 [Glycine soja]
MDPENQLTSNPRSIILNKYEMGRVLGQGNFAKVYHGRNLNTNESVAIKVIKKEKLKKERLVKQIKREVSVMKLVRHPHIVELKEVMATKGKIFLVMEYVKGAPFCHSRGVTHRDLKPENLLLDQNEDLKVSDFGLSALPEQRRADGMLLTPCGTPAYVAPEVLKKKGYDGSKADIWSCGVILFALLCGYLPFQGENVMRIYRKAFRAEYEFPEWISTQAKNLISKLLVADPGKRYSIPDIMKDPWFQVGFMRPIAFSIKESNVVEDNEGKPARPFYNAFEIISSLSHGFDLRSLFETRKRSPSMFISKFSASAVLAKVEAVAKKLNFRVTGKKEFVVRMQGAEEGRKGKLAMTVEVFEVAPEVAVVEFSKSAGDTLEYVRFCDEQVRPSLKDIVWSWQGDTNS